jgi:predicted DCC family thiol-disulfide oxidoreductase YuxK
VPPRETPADEHPVILFDGVCNLCNASVHFIIRNDPRRIFRFAALQSPAAAALLQSASAGPLPDSLVLVENNQVHTRSTAILRIARRLRSPFPLAVAFIILPTPLRDWIYNIIARRRYRWFGKRDSCMVPTPELAARFLD